MKTRIFATLAALAFLFSLSAAHAQDIPAAVRGDLEVGGTFSLANPNLSGTLTNSTGKRELNSNIYGGSLYVNFNILHHASLTAQFDYPDYHTPQDFLEKSYLVGIRYIEPIHYQYIPYVKALVGLGSISYDRPTDWIAVNGTPGTYTDVAIGGGLDIRLHNRFVVRAIDVEAEDWLGFPGGTIHPYIISTGIAYRIR